MRCSEPTRISRSTSVPVTLTRCPTWLVRFSGFAATISIGAARRFKNADFQVREVGARVPAVSVRRNALSERSRQPVIVMPADA